MMYKLESTVVPRILAIQNGQNAGHHDLLAGFVLLLLGPGRPSLFDGFTTGKRREGK
jgi:hypothetical protein